MEEDAGERIKSMMSGRRLSHWWITTEAASLSEVFQEPDMQKAQDGDVRVWKN